MNIMQAMVAKIQTISLEGIQASSVEVEVQIAPGLSSFQVVGLPDNAVKESKDRIRAAFYSCGVALPAKRITVNLTPAHAHKSGSHYDFAIAVGLLTALKIVPLDMARQALYMGELGLDGTLHPVPGVLPAVLHAMQNDIEQVFVPAVNAPEGAWCEDVAVMPVRNLTEFLSHVSGEAPLQPLVPKSISTQEIKIQDNFSDVKGQYAAKRAMEIAAAGGHNLLMCGPPGSGKSMMASRFPALLPNMKTEEVLETSMIHSIAGQLTGGLNLKRPYRSPHHSASAVALSGGGHKALPGEMSLAHKGVLFLDELPEFPRNVLETLRQPLESKEITVSRANHHVTYPASFQFIAAMNPCPCGYMGDDTQVCRCSPRQIESYRGKLSGPLMDRIDLHVGVEAVPIDALTSGSKEESTETIKTRVLRARHRQEERYKENGYSCNAEVGAGDVEHYMPLCQQGLTLLNKAHEKFAVSARSFHRIVRVARTIADLEGCDAIGPQHVAESLGYRYRPYTG